MPDIIPTSPYERIKDSVVDKTPGAVPVCRQQGVTATGGNHLSSIGNCPPQVLGATGAPTTSSALVNISQVTVPKGICDTRRWSANE